jgi:hypothetical protein
MSETAEQFIARTKAKRQREREREVEMTTNVGGEADWQVVASTLRRQRSYPTKVFALDRLRSKLGVEEVRFGYYVLGKAGHWIWVRQPLMVPVEELQPLLDQARADGVL